MRPGDWIASLPYPVRRMLRPLFNTWALALEVIARLMVRGNADSPVIEGIKLVFHPADPNGALYERKTRAALALLRVHDNRSLTRLRRYVGALAATAPDRSTLQLYSRRGRIIIWNARMFEVLTPAILAAELVGWSIEARLQSGGFRAERFRERRERLALAVKTDFASRLPGTEEFVTAWRERLVQGQAAHS